MRTKQNGEDDDDGLLLLLPPRIELASDGAVHSLRHSTLYLSLSYYRVWQW